MKMLLPILLRCHSTAFLELPVKVELYYYEELTLKEISSILEVSESRISQLHTRALAKMKKKMGSYMDILVDES